MLSLDCIADLDATGDKADEALGQTRCVALSRRVVRSENVFGAGPEKSERDSGQLGGIDIGNLEVASFGPRTG